MPKPPTTDNMPLSITVLLNNSPIPTDYLLSSIEIVQKIKQSSIAELVFSQVGFDPEMSGHLSPGSQIELKVAYGKMATLFNGTIEKQVVQAEITSGILEIVIKGRQKEPKKLTKPKVAAVTDLVFGENICAFDTYWDNSQAGIRAYIKISGLAINLGDAVNLIGLGARFDGMATSDYIKHTMSDGNWFTEIGFPIKK